MDKIKNHIKKRKEKEAFKESLIYIAIAFVIAVVLTPIFIFLLAGIV